MLLPRAKVCLERIDARPLPPAGDHRRRRPAPDGRGRRSAPSSTPGSRFADADEATLQDLDFVLRRGQTTAIIGSTGSGKSTIAKLLLRFHDVTQGAICFDGRTSGPYGRRTCASGSPMCPRRPGSSPDGGGEPPPRQPPGGEEDLRHALAVAQAGFVDSLPGDSRPGWSRGQELLRGPEAAAGHRPGPDQAGRPVHFRRQLLRPGLSDRRGPAPGLRQEVAGSSAVLIIAQRVSTIAHADQIIVLEDGRAVGIGRHEELLETCPVYREIAQSQGKGGES